MYDKLSKDFEWFMNNHDHLYETYPDTFLVITDKKVCSTAGTFDEALSKATAAGHEPGTFIIQECTAGDGAYTRSYVNGYIVFA